MCEWVGGRLNSVFGVCQGCLSVSEERRTVTRIAPGEKGRRPGHKCAFVNVRRKLNKARPVTVLISSTLGHRNTGSPVIADPKSKKKRCRFESENEACSACVTSLNFSGSRKCFLW